MFLARKFLSQSSHRRYTYQSFNTYKLNNTDQKISQLNNSF